MLGPPSGTANPLDHYLSEEIRRHIEEQYYGRVNARARLEELLADENFVRNPQGHVATHSDHGIVHVRNVATIILQVLDAADGVLVPSRSPQARRFMKGYGVLLAYVHDIGMVDFSPAGRKMHAEYATQEVFSRAFDAIVEGIWENNLGNLAWHLTSLSQKGALVQEPKLVLREMMAMAVAHSKGTVPAPLLDDLSRLRERLIYVASTPLSQQYEEKLTPVEEPRAYAESDSSRESNRSRFEGLSARPSLPAYYDDFADSAYRWLLAENHLGRQLVSDVIDTIRGLRCADALRQRGTVQKTSGGYELFVNQQTAHAICAMRLGGERMYLVEISEPLSAGEANIASSELSRDGNLRISFHLGTFFGQTSLHRAAHNAAIAVNDIQADVVNSYRTPAQKMGHQICVLLEGVDDNLEFVEHVARTLFEINPSLRERTRTVPALKDISSRERDLYLHAEPLDWDIEVRREILAKIERTGHKTSEIDLLLGFSDVRLVSIPAGSILMEAGDPAGFVYIPLGPGLRGIPLGGYTQFTVAPWIPLGITGVVRGAVRNATIIVDQAVELLMIPREVYLRHWHQTYSMAEFVALMTASGQP